MQPSIGNRGHNSRTRPHLGCPRHVLLHGSQPYARYISTQFRNSNRCSESKQWHFMHVCLIYIRTIRYTFTASVKWLLIVREILGWLKYFFSDTEALKIQGLMFYIYILNYIYNIYKCIYIYNSALLYCNWVWSHVPCDRVAPTHEIVQHKVNIVYHYWDVLWVVYYWLCEGFQS